MSPRSIASRLAEILARQPQPHRLAYTIRAQGDRVTRLAWSPRDGARLAVPARDGGVRVHDTATGALLLDLDGHAEQAMGVAWSHDDSRLASIGHDDELCIWDIARDALHESFTCREGSLTGVAWTAGMLAATSESGCVLRWRDPDAADQRRPGRSPAALPHLVRDEPLANPGALHASFSPDGRHLAVAARGGAVRLWDPWSGTLEARLDGHGDASVITAWSPDGTRFATGAKDGTCRVWDLSRRAPEAVLHTGSAEVRAVAWHPGGGVLAVKLVDAVAFWRPDPWRPVGFIAEPGPELGWSTGLAFHPRLPLLASLGDEDRHVRVWDFDVARLSRDAIPLPSWTRVPVARDHPSPRPHGRRRVVIV